MFRSKIFFIFGLLLYCLTRFSLTAGEIIFAQKEPLFSTRNGRTLGNLSLTVEVKSLDTNPKQFTLIVGDKNSEIIESDKKDKSIWIFSKKYTLNDLKKETKNQSFSLEAKNFREFEPLTESGIRFDMKNWEELNKQAQYTFYYDAAPGKTVSFKAHFYVASKDKKTINIEDEARVTITFTIPQPPPPPRETAQTSTTTPAQVVQQPSPIVKASKPAPQNEPAKTNLTERIEPQPESVQDNDKAEAEILKKLQQSLAEEFKKRTEDANLFITLKNKEITSLLEEIEQMSTNKKRKPSTIELDSLELVISELHKKVDLWDKGYTDILLKEESIQDKFLKFNADQIKATKLLAQVRAPKFSMRLQLTILGIVMALLMAIWLYFKKIMQPKLKIKQLQQLQMKEQQAQAQQKLPKRESQKKKEPETENKTNEENDYNTE